VLRLYPGDRIDVAEPDNGWSHVSGVVRLDRDGGLRLKAGLHQVVQATG
jgi:hypothetical protein